LGNILYGGGTNKMKQSQLYMLMSIICFVGSLLTNHIWDSMLLFVMFFFWSIFSIFFLLAEIKIEKLQRKLERAKDQCIIRFLENIQLNLENIRLNNPKKK